MTTESGARISTLVLTDLEDTARLLKTILSGEPDLVVQRGLAALGGALDAATHHQPDVIVLADTTEALATLVIALDAAVPRAALVVVLAEGDLRGIQECSLAGAAITLFKPFEQAQLIAAVRQAHARALRHPPAAVAAPSARLQRPRIVAVHGVKGGVGASTLAVNLGAALHGLTRRRVAVIDADLLSGDAGVLLDLPPQQSILDILPALRELDAETVDNYFQQHATGVHALLAPEQIQRADAVLPEDVARTLTALRPYFDYQIVDTPSRVTPVTLAVMDQADLVLVVLTPELVALRNAARLLRLTAQLGYPAEKLMLVVNRADTSRMITTAVVEEQLRRAVSAAIPSDGRALVEAMNAGELLVEIYSKSPVAAAIGSLAGEVARHFGWDSGVGAPTPTVPDELEAPLAAPSPRYAARLFGRMFGRRAAGQAS
ncbi:MAG: hypothetical protein AVDCRST_MAG77-5788 [uncultured Chloroflexi bacterium]|uniref:Response regulatory domain-containing protein n=1 Tax=uncultured Chloroflexota bacterium TaxID=166587 RepID=A0A6J4KDA6_9CHLR|nr:MAG: hypothetical protein AVDCRST_MAG77-5788 [uncultured Chloroflexota bacterium]